MLEPFFASDSLQLGYFEFPVNVDSFTVYTKNNEKVRVWTINPQEIEEVLLKDCGLVGTGFLKDLVGLSFAQHYSTT